MIISIVALMTILGMHVVATSAVHVNVNEGKLKGAKASIRSGFEYFEFLGIPYAKPPVGPLRFQSPQNPEPWLGERDATRVSTKNIAIQNQTAFEQSLQIKGSEDCLYLNVVTPALPSNKSKLLPVMVYVHGGGYLFGNGILKEDNGPDFLIGQNVILVSLNYRLGIFGFLSLGIKEARGNMGLKDQIQALKWINKNIVYFGGDKDQVTVFGSSAGSASIEYLILSPQTKYLFQRAILQSGSTLNHWAVNYENKDLALKVAQTLGFKGNETIDLYNYIFNQSEKQLQLESLKIIDVDDRKTIFFGFVPIVERDFGDGDAVLVEKPYKLMAEGKVNNVTVIKGFCNLEAMISYSEKNRYMDNLKISKNFVEILPYIIKNITEINEKFVEAYINESNVSDDFAFDFYGDLDFKSGIWHSIELMSNVGIKSYLYEFSYDGALNLLKRQSGIKKKGACHADDNYYIINNAANGNETVTELDELVVKRMVKIWTNFAKTGNPTSHKSEELPIIWPSFTKNNKVYLSIDKTLKLKKDYSSNRMKLFSDLYKEFGY